MGKICVASSVALLSSRDACLSSTTHVTVHDVFGAPATSPANAATRLSLEAAWVRAGGVFIHHTSASSSLEKLKALLPENPPRPEAEPKEEGEGSAKRHKKG